MKFTNNDLFKIVVGVGILFIMYMILTRNCDERFVAIDQGSLNDCLTSCAQDRQCIAATYIPSANECDVSQKYGELGGINSYSKKDINNGSVFIDEDYNEYNVLESPNARIIDWSLDQAVIPKNTFGQDFGRFEGGNIDESLRYGFDEKYFVDYKTNAKYRFIDEDDFLDIYN